MRLPHPSSLVIPFPLQVESIEQLMRGVEEDIVNYINISTQLEQERKKHSLLLQYEKFKEAKDIEVGVVNIIIMSGCG